MAKGFNKLFRKRTPVVHAGEPLQLRTTPITWGIPFDEVLYSKFMIFFEKHGGKMPWDDFVTSEGTIVQKARNNIHKHFLYDTKADYLMMLDSDIIFPPKMVETLIAHNLPIVGGWYRDKKADDHHPTVYDFNYEDEQGVLHWKHKPVPGKGLEKVDGMGAGCWLMKREVAVALGDEPYNMHAGGEDLVLSRKLHKLGIPLYVDWEIKCAHIGIGII